MAPVPATFDRLIDEADAVSVDGWDFSWLDGRATEERPSWGYQRLLSRRLAGVSAAVDLQTGGGEVLAGAGAADGFPPTMAATESWPPNAARATRLLHPLGVVVVAAADRPPLPFTDEAFDLVSSRHPNALWWAEITRVLRPGGSYLAQHIGPGSVDELTGYFHAESRPVMPDAEAQAADARRAGLDVVDVRSERLRIEFFDIGAVVYFLRKVIWIVPGFSVDRYRDELRALHERIVTDGPFVAHSNRILFDARKPGPT